MENHYKEYDYTSLYTAPAEPAPQAAPAAAAPKKGRGKRIALRITAGVCSLVLCAGVGFGSGYAGSLAAMKNRPADPVITPQTTVTDIPNATASGSMSVSDIVSIAAPSVVAINVEITGSGIFGGTKQGAGSGVIFREDGYVLTNNHVVQGADKITVITSDEKEYKAVVVGTDRTSDVAVLKINADGLNAAKMGNSDELRVGDTAVAIGNPLGTLSGTVTSGIISALNRNVSVEGMDMTLIQTNAAVNPGNSGGGLFNDKAELIGLVNAGATSAEGVGFAIPINDVVTVAEELVQNGAVASRPVIGITAIEIADAAAAEEYGVSAPGVYVRSVEDGSAAQKAGMKPGDMIISFDDLAISRSADISNALSKHEAGDTVIIMVARDRKLVKLKVTLQPAL